VIDGHAPIYTEHRRGEWSVRCRCGFALTTVGTKISRRNIYLEHVMLSFWHEVQVLREEVAALRGRAS